MCLIKTIQSADAKCQSQMGFPWQRNKYICHDFSIQVPLHSHHLQGISLEMLLTTPWQPPTTFLHHGRVLHWQMALLNFALVFSSKNVQYLLQKIKSIKLEILQQTHILKNCAMISLSSCIMSTMPFNRVNLILWEEYISILAETGPLTTTRAVIQQGTTVQCQPPGGNRFRDSHGH